ncbi:hypothetical protein J2X63_000146 [Agromyces sp. 3263]|uniref:hypothetical protein n=1 Tax=Agromyces sp. 3263 TaxID=2817750 RepID=UPI002854B791|nr:hypothetical protein [Agromyces sp. 3263]MDR6904460.1 hypothetical protein [Agromyces sp. 3263]
MRIPRAFVAAAAAAGALALALGTAALPAQADQPAFICEPLDSGKIDNSQPGNTLTVTAPQGQLIDGYCVKAGTQKFYVAVTPPSATVTIDHPIKDSISHYSLSYVDVPDEPEVPEGLAIPVQPGYQDKCGTSDDKVVLPADTDTVKWTSTPIVGDAATATATAQGDALFTNGQATITFTITGFTNEPCEPVLTACATTTSVVTTDLKTWSLGETRATGHNELVDGGLHIWTEGTTTTDKAAGYFPTNLPLASLGTGTIDGSLDYTATTGPEPGLQLVVDFDANGTPDGVLVGEKVYGENWWLTGSSAPAVQALAPHTGGGNGSNWFGTAQEWLAAFPNAVVKAVGYSLGSGVSGDGVITKITLGCVEYTFDADAPTEVIQPKLTGVVASGECVADAPWITYSLTLDDPQHRSTSNTARLVFTAGELTHTVILGDLVNGKLSGKILWPGASVAADQVTPTGWPGWEQLEDGTWVETDGNFAWTRDLTEVTLAVNPEVVVDLAYPEATPDCDSAPTPFDSGTPGGGGSGSATTASTDPGGLASTGFDGITFAIIAAALMALGGGVVLTARMRRRA